MGSQLRDLNGAAHSLLGSFISRAMGLFIFSMIQKLYETGIHMSLASQVYSGISLATVGSKKTLQS